MLTEKQKEKDGTTKHDRCYFKCDVCGKFIGYAEFERGEIKTDYKPETLYECEKITHVHKHCL